MRLDTYCRFPRCERLGGRYAHPAEMDQGDANQLQLLALVTHTSWPHGNGHPIELKVNGGPVPEDGQIDFRIVCTHQQCDRPNKDRTYKIRPEFAGAVAIAHHAEHEGHSLAIYWDGKQIHPPEESQ
jgi:hypothetical protein